MRISSLRRSPALTRPAAAQAEPSGSAFLSSGAIRLTKRAFDDRSVMEPKASTAPVSGSRAFALTHLPCRCRVSIHGYKG